MAEDEIIQVETSGEISSKSKPDSLLVGSGLDVRSFVWLLVDISASMDEAVQLATGPDKYEWTVEYIRQARKLLRYGQRYCNEVLAKYDSSKDEDVKQAVLDDCLSICMPPPIEDSEGCSGLSKLQIAKKSVSDFVRACFAKFPGFQCAVSAFDEGVVDCIIGGNEKSTLQAVDSLESGCLTCIYSSLEHILLMAKRYRNPYGQRVVLVTDGMDQSYEDLKNLVKPFLKARLVCDVVFFWSKGLDPRTLDSGKALIEFVKATGGLIQFADSEKGFERKFLQVASRGLLTEGRK